MLVAMALLITAVVLPKWLVFDTSVVGVVVEIGLFEACVPDQDRCFTYEQLGNVNSFEGLTFCFSLEYDKGHVFYFTTVTLFKCKPT